MDANQTRSLVYQRDFFHHFFHELMSANSRMFQFNESNTLAWFPTRVGLLDAVFQPHSLLLVVNFCGSRSTFIVPDNPGGQENLLLFGHFMWIGLVQREYHRFSIPSGSVQEATQCKANTGRHEGI